MILLSEEEIQKISNAAYKELVESYKGNDGLEVVPVLNKAVAKAQLKKVVEWLEEYDYGDAPTPTQVVNWIKQALLKEVE